MLHILDTTLRDGTQQQGISFSAYEKLQVAEKLDDLGVDFIEGGWPGSNPKDIEFFRLAKKKKWKKAVIAAFGSTHYKKYTAAKDPNLKAILDSGVKVAVLFGKSWDMHVREILGVSLEKNLQMIYDSILFLRKKGLRVIFDAEHFFDGYLSNSKYALKCLHAAENAGAENITLADTNGGMITSDLREIIKRIKKVIKIPLGIHCHNDSDLAVANTLAAVEEGVELIQGTMNGYGERTGNANLCSVISNLQLKMGRKILSKSQLRSLTHTARFIQELANLKERAFAPYVGSKAFTHKGGIHVSAMLKNPESYQHIDPKLVGNEMDISVSELSGRGNILAFMKKRNLQLSADKVKKILKEVKHLENRGFQFEAAEASMELLIQRHKTGYKKPFELIDFMLMNQLGAGNIDESCAVEATIKVEIQNKLYHEASTGNGPVHALDLAFRKGLEKHFVQFNDIHLFDYKVRILSSNLGTDAWTSVLIEMGDKSRHWFTTGSSQNIIEASMIALLDGYEYGLIRS